MTHLIYFFTIPCSDYQFDLSQRSALILLFSDSKNIGAAEEREGTDKRDFRNGLGTSPRETHVRKQPFLSHLLN